jgi:hypothetical protein
MFPYILAILAGLVVGTIFRVDDPEPEPEPKPEPKPEPDRQKKIAEAMWVAEHGPPPEPPKKPVVVWMNADKGNPTYIDYVTNYGMIMKNARKILKECMIEHTREHGILEERFSISMYDGDPNRLLVDCANREFVDRLANKLHELGYVRGM